MQAPLRDPSHVRSNVLRRLFLWLLLLFLELTIPTTPTCFAIRRKRFSYLGASPFSTLKAFSDILLNVVWGASPPLQLTVFESDNMSELMNSDAQPSPKPDLTAETMERLFFWARDRVASVVASLPSPDVSSLGDVGNLPVLGAFVSFKKRGRLRSCMGYMSEGIRLGEALDSSSVTAALRDPRFPPISANELYDLDLEVWILGAMREIQEQGDARRDAFTIGRDGLQIVGRGRRGLLLPSVPVELGWNPDQFLEGLCDKAGLSRGAWKSDDVRLFAFEGVSFKKPFVWHVSRNPELAKVVERLQNAPDASSQNVGRPTFSFNPSFFGLNAPPTRTRQNSRDFASQTRPAAVAGMFYPGDAKEQNAALDEIESSFIVSPEDSRASAAMIPHAGWIYSASLAMKTLRRLEPSETIVVLAPKHRPEGANLAVMPYGAWDYKGGTIPNDLEFVDAFVDAIPEFQKDPIAHRSEHSIEVQLPLLARLFPNAKVVGVLIGRAAQSELDSMAERFAKFLSDRENAGKRRPALVISSDMNHYADDASTRRIDKIATDALETTDPAELLRTVVGRRISMCGILPAYFTLKTLKTRGEFSSAIRVGYATSGDASGDRERVVGYAGYLFR